MWTIHHGIDTVAIVHTYHLTRTHTHIHIHTISQVFRHYSAGLLRPNRTKYRKFQKRLRGVKPVAPENLTAPPLKFGDYGIYARESIRLKANQIEATRMVLLKTIGKKGLKMWVRVFPHIPVTKKPLEVRMGKGKGAVDHFVSNVRAGKMLFEYCCPNTNLAKLGFRAAKFKLPIPVGFVQKQSTAL